MSTGMGGDPDLFHVVPVGYDAMLNGVLQSEDSSFALSLIPDVAVLLPHAHHHSLTHKNACQLNAGSGGQTSTVWTSRSSPGAWDGPRLRGTQPWGRRLRQTPPYRVQTHYRRPGQCFPHRHTWLQGALWMSNDLRQQITLQGAHLITIKCFQIQLYTVLGRHCSLLEALGIKSDSK